MRRIKAWFNERRYRRWLKKYEFKYLSEKPELSNVWTDVDGNNYYMPNNPLGYSTERWIASQNAMDAANYGTTRDELHSIALESVSEMDAAMASGNTGRLAHVRAKLADLAFRIEKSPVEKYTVDLGIQLFLIDGENPEIVENWAIEKKRKMAEKDPALRSFFFENALRSLGTLTRQSQGSTENSLKATRNEKRARLREMLSSPNKSEGLGSALSKVVSQSQTGTPTSQEP